jgi:VanZ family protein
MLFRRLVLFWLPVVIWMIVIIGLSSQSDLPSRTDPTTGERIGSTYSVAKAWHVVEYSVLALLLFRALHTSGGGIGLRPGTAAAISVLTCLAFAGLDELRQSFVPKREASIYDVVLDTLAASIAVTVCALWRQSRQRIRTPVRR